MSKFPFSAKTQALLDNLREALTNLELSRKHMTTDLMLSFSVAHSAIENVELSMEMALHEAR
jgi:hypothetical protein